MSRTGNEVLAMSLARAGGGGRRHRGVHLHASARLARPRCRDHHRHVGPAGRGSRRRRLSAAACTADAIELYAASVIESRGGKKVRIELEEGAFFDGETVRWLDGRQTAFHLIPRPAGSACCAP